jgi:hypothetical protein
VKGEQRTPRKRKKKKKLRVFFFFVEGEEVRAAVTTL